MTKSKQKKRTEKIMQSSKHWVLILGFVFAFAMTGFYISDQKLKTAAEVYASDLFDLPVEIKHATKSGISNTYKLKGIHIKNPEGFAEGTMIKIDGINITSQSLTARPIAIDRVTIQGVRFNAQRNTEEDLNLTVFFDYLASTSLEERDLDLKISPDSIFVYNVTLKDDTVRDLGDQDPLSENDTNISAPTADWIKSTFKAYGYPLFQGLVESRVEQGVKKARAQADRVLKDLKILSENVETSIMETLGLKP